MPGTTQNQPMTVEAFGKSVKAKYPQYNNVDDAELGRKVLEKYPVYKDRVSDTPVLSQPGAPVQPQAQPQPQKGALQGAADTINSVYEGYKNLPVIKQARQAVGGVVATGGALLGGGIAAVGNPIANTIEGKPLFQNFAKDVKDTALSTAHFGRQIGEEGTAAAPLGAAGKIVTLPLGFAQGFQGSKDLQEGLKNKDTAQAFEGALGLGTAAIGLKSAIGEKGIFLNEGPKQTVIDRYPKTKPLLAPVKTAKEVAAPVITAAKNLPIVENIQKGAKDFASGRLIANESGAETATMNLLDPNRAVPAINPKTGKPTPSTVISSDKQQGIYQRFQNYRKVAQKSVENNANPPAFEVAGRKGGEALVQYENKLNKWGEIKKQELEKFGDKPVDITGSAERFRNDLNGSLGTNIVQSPTGEYILLDAPGRRSKIALDPSDQSLLVKATSEIDRLGSSNSVRMIDDTVDALQDLLYKRKQNVAIPVNNQVERILKKTVGELNSKVKRVAGPTYRKANDKYSYFIETRDKLNKALGPDEQRGASLMKRVFSPTDGGTRKLFEQIKRDTGIDLIEEATMAKAAGELAGDVRQRSLLESIGMLQSGGHSPTGLLGSFLKLGKDQIISKEKVLDSASRGTGTKMRR